MFLLDIYIRNESFKIYFCFLSEDIKIIFSIWKEISKNYIKMNKNKMNLVKCICASATIGIAIKTAFLYTFL